MSSWAPAAQTAAGIGFYDKVFVPTRPGQAPAWVAKPPLTAAAREGQAKYDEVVDDPVLGCVSPGMPRVMLRSGPYAVRFIERGADLVLQNEWFEIDRTIHMDGREHPKGRDLIPTFYGHSIGRWEGDTLVVDTVGFNEQNWIDTEGLMHTDQYHQIERFTRTDFNTLRYEVTIDDPGAYTAPWTAGFLLRWDAGAEIFEYICQENNKNPDMTIDDDGKPLSRANGHTP